MYSGVIRSYQELGSFHSPELTDNTIILLQQLGICPLTPVNSDAKRLTPVYSFSQLISSIVR